ncbi:helix-turn-helix domain-containing protein [Variovorax robiniae]
MGDFLGVSRQRANFAVQQLRREGLLELQYSQICIVDPARLARRAGL